MSKRYATVNTLEAETPMPLLDWLAQELGMSHDEMRSVSAWARVDYTGDGGGVGEDDD